MLLQKENCHTGLKEDLKSKNKVVSQTPDSKISKPSTVSDLQVNPVKNVVSSQNPKLSTKNLNQAPDSAKSHVTDVCDQVVSDYLKRNGFEEVLNDFRSVRKVQTFSESPKDVNENAESSLTLEKLLKFEKKNRKKNFESQERALDSWTNIGEGFSDLADHLNPDDPDSEVDKVIKYIIDANIFVRYFNVKYNHITNILYLYTFEVKSVKKACSTFKIGRFSRGAKGEDGVIIKNWEKLVKDANIQNPLKCSKDFKKLSRTKGTDHLSLRKRNVLGCYLGQNLPYIRHGTDVYQRSVAVLYPCNEGRYTKEEDELILEEVKKDGANQNTWLKLAKLFNRRKASNIAKRHDALKKRSENKLGTWSVEDYCLFFDYIFKERNPDKEVGADYINSIKTSVIMESGEVLNRVSDRVYCHWTGYVKPLLLSYHSGRLHTEWKLDFFDYLIKSKVNSTQDIDWDEAKSKFQNESVRSLAKTFVAVRTAIRYQGIPLYLAVKDFKEIIKHQKSSESSKALKEKIVFLYDKARGVLDE